LTASCTNSQNNLFLQSISKSKLLNRAVIVTPVENLNKVAVEIGSEIVMAIAEGSDADVVWGLRPV